MVAIGVCLVEIDSAVDVYILLFLMHIIFNFVCVGIKLKVIHIVLLTPFQL